MALGLNYAEKYSPIVDERFKIGPLTSGMVNNQYDWVGVKTVQVYSIPTAALNDYDITQTANRYGTPAELQNDVQELAVTKDRSFTFTIDRKNRDDSMLVMDAATALRRQIDERVIPELDKYRIAALVSGALSTNVIDDTAASAANAYSLFLEGQEKLDDGLAPQGGRFAIVTPKFLNFIKLSDNFVKKGDMAQQIAITGVVGEIDGVYIIKAPSTYFPTNVNCVIANNMVMPSPVKLEDYRVHRDPPGISGWLVEGRIRYDAFVLNEKKAAIAVIANPS